MTRDTDDAIQPADPRPAALCDSCSPDRHYDVAHFAPRPVPRSRWSRVLGWIRGKR